MLMLVGPVLSVGFASGWWWRGRKPVIVPVSVELLLDAESRPSSLKQFITMPDGRKLQHGSQFAWEWRGIFEDLDINREDYDAGYFVGLASWNSPLPTPNRPFDAEVLTKHPDAQ